MCIYFKILHNTVHISIMINSLNFKHSAANFVIEIVEVNWIQLNQRELMVYIVSFDEKSPFVYASVFVLFCLLVGFLYIY